MQVLQTEDENEFLKHLMTGVEIHLLDVERWVFDMRRSGTRGPATIRRYIARLKAMLNWAAARDLMPAVGVKWKALRLAPEPKGRTRRFPPEEEARVKAVASPWLRQAIDFSLDTGVRRGTLLNLTFAMVDLDESLLVIPRRLLKNKRSADDLRIPLTPRAKAIVEFRNIGPLRRSFPLEAFIFGTSAGRQRRCFREGWIAALAAAKVERDPSGRGWSLHWHDIRGEFASRLHEAGVDLATIQHLLDHSSSTMTDRYVRPRLRMKRDAMDKLQAWNAQLAIELLEKQQAGKPNEVEGGIEDPPETIH